MFGTLEQGCLSLSTNLDLLTNIFSEFRVTNNFMNSMGTTTLKANKND
jgi:hypothetical protein